MRYRIVIVISALAIAFSLLPGTTALAAPANDDFADATAVPNAQAHSFDDTVDTTTATTEGSEPVPSCLPAGATLGKTVWYKYLPPNPGAPTFALKSNTFNSGFDTVLVLYQGTTLGNLQQLSCNNNINDFNGESRVVGNLTQGTTYYLQLGGLNGAGGAAARFRIKQRKWNAGLIRNTKWFLRNGDTNTVNFTFHFGAGSDRRLAGDWRGHGAFLPWYKHGNVWHSNDWFDNTDEKSFAFASASDFPIVGDWNDDGAYTPGVVRGNLWMVSNQIPPATLTSFTFGSASDRKIVGDWNGDGLVTPALVRGNVWYVSNSLPAAAPLTTFTFGSASDRVVAGDWDGDGDWEPGLVRGNVWYLANNTPATSISQQFVFGSSTDVPIVGDWDGTVE
jgi:hypothetical protein